MNPPIYRSGSTVAINVEFIDESTGNPVTPTGISYRVYDEWERDLIPSTALPQVPTAGSANIIVDGQYNTLPATQPQQSVFRMARTVEITMTDVSGANYTNKVMYVIEDTHGLLIIPSTSYMTYSQAIMAGMEIPNTPSWDAASEQDRIAALIDACKQLSLLRYKIGLGDQTYFYGDQVFYYGDQTHLYLTIPTRLDWLTYSDFLSLPNEFMLALRKAQLAQADDILGGDPIEQKRIRGLMSETIGTSSNMYRPGKPLSLPVCKRALRYLGGYVTFVKDIGRG